MEPKPTFAPVWFTPEDIADLAPKHWTLGQCESWLYRNEAKIQAAMWSAGFRALEDLLPKE